MGRGVSESEIMRQLVLNRNFTHNQGSERYF